MEEIQSINSLDKLMIAVKTYLSDDTEGIRLYDKLCIEVDTIKRKAKKEKWEELIESGRMGYQATLMNLRNFLKYNVGMEHIQKVANFLSTPAQVLKSKMFPFRYLSAYRALHGNAINITPSRGFGGLGGGSSYSSYSRSFGKPTDVTGFDLEKVKVLCDALESAAVASINNVDMFVEDQEVLIACDVSSSMFAQLSRNSSITNYDVGLFMGLLLKKKSPGSTIGIFGNDWKVKDDLDKYGALEGVSYLYSIEGEVGYSTHGYKVLEYANQGHKYDRIMMFTDGQMYDDNRGNSIPQLWAKYKENNPQAKLYLFDLVGYRGQPIEIGKNDAYLISGWSNEIFSVLKNLEDGKSALENINSIEL